MHALLKREGIVSALCVPLKSRSGTSGVLNLTRLHGRPFTQRHLWFTALLGERLASSIEVARLFTEREQLQAQLVQSAKMASLGVMASGIAHEVRNPLAIVSAAAQLVRDRPADQALRAEALDKIQRSIARASGIIETISRAPWWVSNPLSSPRSSRVGQRMSPSRGRLGGGTPNQRGSNLKPKRPSACRRTDCAAIRHRISSSARTARGRNRKRRIASWREG